MSALLRRYAERIDALTLRERVLIFIAAALVLVAFAYLGLIAPLMEKDKRLSREVARRQTELAMLQTQLQAMARTSEMRPDEANRAKLEGLQRDIAQLDRQIEQAASRFTTPRHMREVLQQILARNSRLQLVDLKTLPVDLFGHSDARGAEADLPPRAGAHRERRVPRPVRVPAPARGPADAVILAQGRSDGGRRSESGAQAYRVHAQLRSVLDGLMSRARRFCGLLTSFAAAQAIVAQAGAAPPAEGLADPTRPPYSGRGVGAAPVAGPELQSVLISPTRKVAVINGQTVPLGGKFRDATLTRITESGVELQSGSRVEVLRLFPQAEKKSLRGATPPGKN